MRSGLLITLAKFYHGITTSHPQSGIANLTCVKFVNILYNVVNFVIFTI
jgi:hypothetical protein